MSIGIGPNLLLARIATRTAKPAGSFHLPLSSALAHLAPLPLSVLPGFGYNTIEKIESKWGVKTCGDVRELAGLKEAGAVQKALGPGTGTKLWNFVRGVDGRELKAEEVRRSVSASINVRPPNSITSNHHLIVLDSTQSASRTSNKSARSASHSHAKYPAAWKQTPSSAAPSHSQLWSARLMHP